MRGNIFLKIADNILGRALVFVLGVYCFLTGRLRAKDGDVNSILVIKLSAIGDTILLIPVLRALRKKFPKANISMLASPINKEVVGNCPYIDEVIEFKIQECVKNPVKLIGFIKELRKRGFDTAIDADQWLRISALLSYFSGAFRRIGFRTGKQFKHLIFTNKINHARNKHEAGCFYDLVRPLGIDEINTELEYRIKDEDKKEASDVLKALDLREGRFIIVHPEVPAHAFQRSWPEENFIELVNGLSAVYGAKILLTGTRNSREMILRIINASEPKYRKDVLEFTGHPFRIFSAVLQKSRLLICGNTGVMHLACALKVPVVALHGPTDPVKWGPLGAKTLVVSSKLDCSPCLYLGFEYGCRDNRCMKSIEVKEVLKAAERLLGKP